MKKILLLPFIFSFFTLSLYAQEYLSDRLIVRLTAGEKINDFCKSFNAAEKSLGELTVVQTVAPGLNIHLLSFDAAKCDAASATEILQKQKNILSAEQDQIARERGIVPNDTRYEAQWNMAIIGLEEVWEVTTGGTTQDGREIVIMVADSGFDLAHPEFAGNIWVNSGEIPDNGIDDDNNGYTDDIHGWNFMEESNEYSYANDHGTQVAGIAGAKGNNNQGLTGVGWDVKLMFMQTNTKSGTIAAYQYMTEMRRLYNQSDGAEGAFVVASNLSLGFSGGCPEQDLINTVFNEAGEQGVLHATATYNDNLNVDIVGDNPTGCNSDFMISVTNTNMRDNKVESAGFGATTIDIGAPSGNSVEGGIFAVYPENRYNDTFGGCSGAAPHVAGTIALMYALPCELITQDALTDPAATALRMKRAILEGAEPNTDLRDITVSGGRLSAYRSMLWWQSYCAEPREDFIDIQEYIETYNTFTQFVNVYPNPANGLVTFEYSLPELRDFEVRVYDALGRLVRVQFETAEAFAPLSFTMDTSLWSEGIYYVSLVNGKNPTTVSLAVVKD